MRNPKKEAQKLLRKSKAGSIPIDLEKIASSLKIPVLYDEFDDHISGLLVVKNGKTAVGVNKKHHPNRQRFTIAHELGHYVLHHKYGDDPKNDIHIDKKWAYFRSDTAGHRLDEQERQANQFAAELLMPQKLVEEIIEKYRLDLSDDFDIFKLANLLQVSEQALAIRLVGLRMIKPY